MIFSQLFSKLGLHGSASELEFDDFAASLKGGTCLVVDVREAREFADGHVPGSVNLPLSRFSAEQLPGGKEVVLICRSGARSAKALAVSVAGGRQDVRHYREGFVGWTMRGGAVAK